MPRTPAQLTQADVARVIRAARQAGADSVEVRLPAGAVVVVRLEAPAAEAGANEPRVDPKRRIVL